MIHMSLMIEDTLLTATSVTSTVLHDPPIPEQMLVTSSDLFSGETWTGRMSLEEWQAVTILAICDDVNGAADIRKVAKNALKECPASCSPIP